MNSSLEVMGLLLIAHVGGGHQSGDNLISHQGLALCTLLQLSKS
jgi:hypothetical protein